MFSGKFGRLAFALLATTLLFWLGGCTSLPVIDRGAIASQAVPLDPNTPLGRIAKVSTPSPELSGFRLMPLGLFSLDTRVQLARRAEKSIDVQYYYIADDETGRWLLRALRDAADRGVRVRVLIDDLYTGGKGEFWLAFAAHKNVEVRLFNPFCCARSHGPAARFVADASDWSRLNHRMHNKLFIADGAMAVIGGRNVANEYFLRGASQNFVDVDAFTIGWVVSPLEFQFDRYWNSAAVFPLKALARTDLDDEQLRARFEVSTGPVHTPPPKDIPTTDVLGYGPISDDLAAGRLGLIWGEAFVFADHPDKPFDAEAGDAPLDTSVTANLFDVIASAQTEVVASSPYFIPGESSLGVFRELRSRGVAVTILTNSLASNDEPVVHVGYAKHRKELLRMGVRLYELSSKRVSGNKRPFLFGKSLGRLHAKTAVIDRKTLFIGSMNIDPRSASINTELGAVIHSPQLARELLRVIDIDRLFSSYRVELAPDGNNLRWIGYDGKKELVLTHEPDSTPWLRLKAWLLTPFVPIEQL